MNFQNSQLYRALITDQGNSFEEGAEKECEKFAENAIKWNNQNAEVFVLKANLLASQDKPELASQAILTSYSLWKNQPGQSLLLLIIIFQLFIQKLSITQSS